MYLVGSKEVYGRKNCIQDVHFNTMAVYDM